MPSPKNPITSVNVGPGRIPANSVDSSALTFPLTGGGDIQNHIADPVDAHMAGAVGIPPVHPVTGDPLLASAGGPYDGESVLDALTSLKDLLPVKPDRLGFNNAVANSGIPVWGANLDSATKGGFTNVQAIPTKNLLSAATTQNVNGVLYPADRGVLALYRTTSSTNPDFTNASQTTLVAALWLGSSPSPVGIPDAAFVEATRATGQANHPIGGGLDLFALTARLPYQSTYGGGEYTPFPSNFSAYQLAKYSYQLPLSAGINDSYQLVHWKETYATSLTAIQPAALAAGLVSGNMYSASAADGTFYDNVRRLNVYVDSDSGTGPTGGTFTSSPAGTPSTTILSGITYYSSGLTFDITATATNLFKNSFVTNTVASVSVPSGFTSSVAPVVVNTTFFGGSSVSYPLFDGSPARITDTSDVAFSLIANPPLIATVAKFRHATHPGPALGIPDPRNPNHRVQITWNAPFSQSSTVIDSTQYLYMPSGLAAWTGSTPTDSPSTNQFESFCDETYRYLYGFSLPSATARIDPSLNGGGAGDYDSTVALGAPVANAGDLQVMGGKLVYPKDNFLASAIRPIQSAGRNYSTLGDTIGVTMRHYVRAFQTNGGQSGTLRITGLAFTSFDAVDTTTGNFFTDHPGGAAIEIRAATNGATWQDMGRPFGTGNGALAVASPVTDGVTGELVLPYTLPSPGTTGTAGGDIPLFVRITFLNTVTGNALSLNSMRWSVT